MVLGIQMDTHKRRNLKMRIFCSDPTPLLSVILKPSTKRRSTHCFLSYSRNSCTVENAIQHDEDRGSRYTARPYRCSASARGRVLRFSHQVLTGEAVPGLQRDLRIRSTC